MIDPLLSAKNGFSISIAYVSIFRSLRTSVSCMHLDSLKLLPEASGASISSPILTHQFSRAFSRLIVNCTAQFSLYNWRCRCWCALFTLNLRSRCFRSIRLSGACEVRRLWWALNLGYQAKHTVKCMTCLILFHSSSTLLLAGILSSSDSFYSLMVRISRWVRWFASMATKLQPKSH